MNKRKKWAFRLLAVVLIVGLPVGAVRFWRGPGWASLLVALQREKFDAAAEAVRAGEEPALPLGVTGYSATGGVSFDLGAWGFGSATSYWGVYPADHPYGAGVLAPDGPLSPDGAGWSWREPEGDNTYYTQAVADGWWYWRASY